MPTTHNPQYVQQKVLQTYNTWLYFHRISPDPTWSRLLSLFIHASLMFTYGMYSHVSRLCPMCCFPMFCLVVSDLLLSCFWSSLLFFSPFLFACLSFCLDCLDYSLVSHVLTFFSRLFIFPLTFGKLLYVLHKVSIQIPSNLHPQTDSPDVNEGNIPQVGRGLELIVGWPSPKKRLQS